MSMDTPLNPTQSNANMSNFFSGDFAENPFPLFTQMRELGPVISIPSPFTTSSSQQTWMVTRLDEAVQVLKDQKHFVVDPSTIGNNTLAQDRVQRRSQGLGLISQSMIFKDEPDHRRLRALVSQAFTPRYIQSLRPHIQAIADDLLDQVEAQGRMDLVKDYGYPLPINVISDMLGVPREHREQIREGSEALAANSKPGQIDAKRAKKVEDFSGYIVQLVAEKRLHPGDDLMSQLIQIEAEGEHLSESELLSMVALLIFAGHETTSNLISIGTLMLLDHPAQLARLQEDPNLIPFAVEELLRFNGPVPMPGPRFATEDIELGGQQISKGDAIMTVLSSANRDTLHFTDPEDLEIARSLNRHIAFGQGVHVCLGAPLARLEGDIAFSTLLRRLPALHLNTLRETIQWRGTFGLRSITSLPVAF